MRAPDFPLIKIDTGYMMWDGENRILTADMSTLDKVYSRRPFRRVYDDAADQGCYVVSERTGRKVLFTICNVEYSECGDLLRIDLEPAEQVGVYMLSVFND